MASRTRSKKKIGRTDSRELSGVFYDVRVPLPGGKRRSHALDILLQFCPVLDAKPELRGKLKFTKSTKLDLSFGKDDDEGVKPIVMFPDSRRAEKKWDGFRQLTRLFMRSTYKRKVIWAGDKFIPARGMPSSRFLNLTGNTSLEALPTLVGSAEWVISNDSGPIHLAAAMGVNTMAIFGPTDPALYGPYPLNAAGTLMVQAPAGNLKLLQAKEVYMRFLKAEKRINTKR